MIESSTVRHILRDVGTLRLNAPLFCLSVDRFYESFAKDFELFDDCQNIRHQCCLVTDAAICWHRTIHMRYLQHTVGTYNIRVCYLHIFIGLISLCFFDNCCTEYVQMLGLKYTFTYLLTYLHTCTNTNNIIVYKNVEIV